MKTFADYYAEVEKRAEAATKTPTDIVEQWNLATTDIPALVSRCRALEEALDTAEHALIYFETQEDLGSDAEYAKSKRKKLSAVLSATTEEKP